MGKPKKQKQKKNKNLKWQNNLDILFSHLDRNYLALSKTSEVVSNLKAL